MRGALWKICALLGMPALLRRRNRHHLTIVLYHGVAPQVRFGIHNYRKKFIAPEIFRQHLEYIAKRYTVLELDEALAKLQEGTLPPYPLVITFDDGYRNFYEHALPALKEYRMPAAIFLASGFVLRREPLWVDRLEYICGQMTGTAEERAAFDAQTRARMKTLPPNEREAELSALEAPYAPLRDFSGERVAYAPLEKSMVEDMRKYGITIGAHTQTHPILSTVPEEALDQEIAGSLTELHAAFGSISSTFAYPNGQESDFTPRVVASLHKAGFTAALTTLEGTYKKGDDLFTIKRIALDGVETIPLLSAAISGLRGLIRRIIH